MDIEAPKMLGFTNQVLADFGQKEWMKTLDVKAEAEKVKAKTSTLPKVQRDWVVTKAYQLELVAFINGYQKTLSFRFQELVQAVSDIPGKARELFGRGRGKR